MIDFENTHLTLQKKKINDGLVVRIEVGEPTLIFNKYSDDPIKLKRMIENACDDFIEKEGFDIHTSFSHPSLTFTRSEISLTREYSF